MKTHRTLLATALVAAFALGAGAPAFAADPHQHAAGAPTKLMLDHGKKWATDEPLRKGMDEIRALMVGKLDAIHKAKLTPAEYKALGAAVEQQVAGIVAQCKLAPEADAMLHLVVADLLAGTDVMQGKAKGQPAQGAHKVVTAANSYGRYFDHPGWKGVG